jgi:hypothetical protein
MTKRLKDIKAMNGETLIVTNKWSAEAEKRATMVSASTWTYSGAGTLSGASLAGTTATVKLAPTCSGCLANTVTLANGETLIALRAVDVRCAPTSELIA